MGTSECSVPLPTMPPSRPIRDTLHHSTRPISQSTGQEYLDAIEDRPNFKLFFKYVYSHVMMKNKDSQAKSHAKLGGIALKGILEFELTSLSTYHSTHKHFQPIALNKLFLSG